MIFTNDITYLLDQISETGLVLIQVFSKFFEYINYSIHIEIPYFIDVNISVFNLMFTAAIQTFIVFTVYKWLKSIVPFI